MKNPTFIDYLSLGILILLALAVFLVRIFIPDINRTPLVDTLFSFFEITFSILIGFILQRLDSTKKFREDLRKYGLSAYRRISDISKSLARAKREINLRRKDSSDTDLRALDVLSAIIDGTDDTVKSSITDWADIIGDDLKTQEKIQELEANLSIQKISRSEGSEKEGKIQELQNEISILRSKLPYSLRNDQASVQDDLDIVDAYLGGMVSSSGFIVLKIKDDDKVYSDNFIAEVRSAKPYTFTLVDKGVLPFGEISVRDCHNNFIGKVVNPFINSVYVDKVWSTICSNRKISGDDKAISVAVDDAEIGNSEGYIARIIMRVPASMYAYQ